MTLGLSAGLRGDPPQGQGSIDRSGDPRPSFQKDKAAARRLFLHSTDQSTRQKQFWPFSIMNHGNPVRSFYRTLALDICD
jgi:hypothetical protein